MHRDAATVSVLMPVRDEGPAFDDVLRRVCEQDYPIESILVAVGPSRDGTRDIAATWASRDRRVRVVDNPEGIVSTGLNRALQEVTTTHVVRVDGHCRVPPDYVARLVREEQRTGASCVGPRLRTVGHGLRQRGIAAAMSSSLGVGGARFRTSSRSGPVTTVPFGLYRTGLLRELGGFREDLVRNQDDELNARLRRAGGTIHLVADLVVDYVPRGTFAAVARQYREYGWWRIVTATDHGDRLRPQQLAPAGLVAGGALGLGLAVAGHPSVMRTGTALYAGVLATLVAQTRRRTGDLRVALLSGAAGATLQVSYGVGMWQSLLSRQLRTRPS